MFLLRSPVDFVGHEKAIFPRMPPAGKIPSFTIEDSWNFDGFCFAILELDGQLLDFSSFQKFLPFSVRFRTINDAMNPAYPH